MASKNLTSILLASILISGCAYHAPDGPSPVPVPVSTAAASLRLVSASRVDRTTDVVATVLTSTGTFVSGARVEFVTSTGTLSTSAGVTDANGTARSILTNGSTATVRATVAGLSNEITVPGVPVNTDPTVPPVIAPPPAPLPTPSAGINVASLGVVGQAIVFAVAAPGLGQTWHWTFGDGATTDTTAFSTSHTYVAVGVYTATVSAAGVTPGSASIAIGAAPLPPPAPAAFAVNVNCPKPTTLTVACNVSAFANGAALPSGAITSVTWDFGDGPSLAPTAVPIVTHTYASTGTYTIFATVTASTASGPQIATASTSVTTP